MYSGCAAGKLPGCIQISRQSPQTGKRSKRSQVNILIIRVVCVQVKLCLLAQNQDEENVFNVLTVCARIMRVQIQLSDSSSDSPKTFDPIDTWVSCLSVVRIGTKYFPFMSQASAAQQKQYPMFEVTGSTSPEKHLYLIGVPQDPVLLVRVLRAVSAMAEILLVPPPFCLPGTNLDQGKLHLEDVVTPHEASFYASCEWMKKAWVKATRMMDGLGQESAGKLTAHMSSHST